MVLTEQEKNDVLEQFDVIIDQDQYIENSEIIYSEELEKLEYRTGDLLIQLLASISLNKELEKFLIEKMFLNKRYYRLMFYISCNYGLLDNFLDIYKYSRIGIDYDEVENMTNLFDNFLEYFIKFFNKGQLNIYLNILKSQHYQANSEVFDNLSPIFYSLKKKIINHKFNELSNNLTGINIEINKDKEEVKEIINHFGFDNKYNEFLTTLDKHFYSENKDNIEMAGLIGTFRQFNNDIIIDIALEVATNEGLSDIPKLENSKSTSKIGRAGDYLKEKFNLSKNEDKFLEYFTKILHEEGGHAFLSSIEYFRLTKNITIEIILLLLYKLKDFKENNK
ncbi:MAG: hypothetical protein QM490_02710 [Candidatus Gracilibacteria bacterium]